MEISNSLLVAIMFVMILSIGIVNPGVAAALDDRGGYLTRPGVHGSGRN